MDAERRSLIATALVGLVVLAVIIGSIYYLIQFIRNRQGAGSEVADQQLQVSASPLAAVSAPPVAANPSQTPAQQPSGDFKTFNAGEFQVTYPKNWGILTCANTGNIEFDPTNSQDQIEVNCTVASKPITIIKNATACEGGQMADLGQVKVSKTKANDGDYIRYEWCSKTVPPLYITHRVSQDNSPATSKEDFSRQVEELISRISFVQGS